RPQTLRGVELEHPTLTLLADVERAEVAQSDTLAALERRIDLLERGIDDLLYEGGISAGPVRDQRHQCRLLDTPCHCAVLEGCDVLIARPRCLCLPWSSWYRTAHEGTTQNVYAAQCSAPMTRPELLLLHFAVSALRIDELSQNRTTQATHGTAVCGAGPCAAHLRAPASAPRGCHRQHALRIAPPRTFRPCC